MWTNIKKYFFNIISSGFSKESDIDILRRVYLLNLMLIFGMTFTALLGSVAFFSSGVFLGAADLILFMAFLAIMICLRKTKNLETAASMSVIISGFFFFSFLATGGINNTAFVWAYVYPLISFFLLGIKKGAWAAFALLFFSTVSFALSSQFDFLADYKTDLIIRFIPSYITVALVAFVMEKTRKIVQEKLISINGQLKKANQVKTDLLNMTVHDLKNPLNTIRSAAEMLGDTELTPDDKKELTGVIKNSSDSMLRIIERFLESSTIEDEKFKLQFEKLNLSEILSEEIISLQTLAAKKKQIISASIEDGIIILGEKTYTIKIFQNLIGNSIKYSPQNTEITVALSKINDSVLVEISDQGAGFSEEDKSKIFSRFQKLSAKPTGGEISSGFGLFIVKKLVDSHNGKIWLESEKGKGATFFIQFPAL